MSCRRVAGLALIMLLWIGGCRHEPPPLTTGPLILPQGDDVLNLAFSPARPVCLTTCADGSLGLWDTRTGQLLTDAVKPDGFVELAEFSPDGHLLMLAVNHSRGGEVQVYDGLSWRELQTIDVPANIASIAFSADGASLAIGCKDKSVQVLDAHTGRMITPRILTDDWVLTVDFSADGHRLLVGGPSEGRIVNLSDLRTLATLSARNDRTAALVLCGFSVDGRRVLGYERSNPAAVSVWDGESGKPLWDPLVLDGSVDAIGFAPDGKQFVAVVNGHVAFFDTEKGSRQLDTLPKGSHYSAREAFSADGTQLATGGRDGVQVWDLVAHRLQLEEDAPVNPISLAISPDNHLIGASGRRAAYLWPIKP